MNNILLAQSKLKKTEAKLNSFLRYVYGEKLRVRKQELQSVIDNLIYEKLYSENTIFKDLIKECKRLLANDNIKFKVNKEGGNPAAYMTTKFEGKIHKNGFLYLYAIETPPVFSFFYPGGYLGSMDFMGKAKVSINNTKFQAIGGRVPSSYIGKIDINGSIEFKTKESWFEIHGHFNVSKIIADPFNGNNIKRKKYLYNRSKLLTLVSEWKKNNLA